MNTYQKNLDRLATLEKYVPCYLKEKEFAFVNLRPLIITAQDIEDNDYTSEEVAQFVARGARELAKVEKRAAKLGY
jgi:hypothetical protein